MFIRHYPPQDGEGVALLDDVSVIQWERLEEDPTIELDVPAPNNWSWMRFTPDAITDSIGVDLTHRIFTLNSSAY